METQSRCFPYEKSIVINALYDTIDALGLKLVSSNSVRGTLIVCDSRQTWKMRIAIGFVAEAGQTWVEVFPEGEGTGFVKVIGTVILDELTGRMQQVHLFIWRNTAR